MKRRHFILKTLPGATVAWAMMNSGCNRTDTASRPGTSGDSSVVKGAGGSREVVFWHTQTGDNQKALEELCSKFTAENGKGISIRPLWQGDYTQLYQKLMNAVHANQPPELAVSYESMVSEYMKAGAVIALDDYIKGPNGLSAEDLADIFPAFLETNRYPQHDGKTLSFPFTKSLLVNYVNMTALKSVGLNEPPASWQDFIDAGTKLTRPARGSTPAMHGLAVDVNPSTIDGWIMSHGGELLDSSGAALDSPEALATFTDLNTLFRKDVAYQTRGDTYQADFGAQRAGMVCTSSTQRILFRPLINDRFEWELAMIPQTRPENPVTVLYGASVCIFKTTQEKQDAAWEFLRWLSLKEQAAYWAIHSSYMPLRRSVAAMPEMKAAWVKDPQGKQAFDLITYAKPEPNSPGWQNVRDHLTEALESIIAGTKTPEQAVKDLDSKADQSLKKTTA